MRERKLTEEQESRLTAIKEAWMKEKEELEKDIPKPKYQALDGELTNLNLRLQKKYLPLMYEILREGMDENEKETNPEEKE